MHYAEMLSMPWSLFFPCHRSRLPPNVILYLTAIQNLFLPEQSICFWKKPCHVLKNSGRGFSCLKGHVPRSPATHAVATDNTCPSPCGSWHVFISLRICTGLHALSRLVQYLKVRLDWRIAGWSVRLWTMVLDKESKPWWGTLSFRSNRR